MININLTEEQFYLISSALYTESRYFKEVINNDEKSQEIDQLKEYLYQQRSLNKQNNVK